MDLLSHPFRVDGAGRIVTVEPGSIDHTVEAVAVTVLTSKDARPLAPDFGVSDPTFAALDVAELQAVLDTFGPVGVRVDLEDADYSTDGVAALTLTVTTD